MISTYHLICLQYTHGTTYRFTEGYLSGRGFVYEESTDTYRCPAGKELTRRAYHAHRHTIEYMAKMKGCRVCELRVHCTRDSSGRSVHRSIRKEDLEAMLSITQSPEARRDIKTRQHSMERSYARSTRYGFDQARWRGLWKVSIQKYLICTIQNIEILIRHATKPLKGALCLKPLPALEQALGRIFGLCRGFIVSLFRNEGASRSKALNGFVRP